MLIIWDRMFGTFQEERDDRKPVFGLNSQVNTAGLACAAAVLLYGVPNQWHSRCALQPVVQGTYNPLWHQIHHLAATLKLANSGTVCDVPNQAR